MSLHDNINAPPSPAASDGSSSSGSASPGAPLTPPLSTSLPMTTFMNFTSEDTLNGVPILSGTVKRAAPKNNTRRVNSAERRATHNAVERARRETLNGRFLDLAAMLPNLSQIRRPSKSAIVNSSIAHLNASRRHRILAAQQLRVLKDESDALRHEINQWRARSGAGIPPVEEPVRGDAFAIVLSGELEFEQADLVFEGEDSPEEEGEYYPGRHYAGAADHAAGVYAPEESVDGYAMMRHQQQQQMLAAQQQQIHHDAHAHPHPHAVPEHSAPAVYPPAPAHAPAHYYPAPTIVDPAHAAVYENPAVGYDQQQYPQPASDAHAQWAYDKQLMHAHAQQMHHHQRQQQQVPGGW